MLEKKYEKLSKAKIKTIKKFLKGKEEEEKGFSEPYLPLLEEGEKFINSKMKVTKRTQSQKSMISFLCCFDDRYYAYVLSDVAKEKTENII